MDVSVLKLTEFITVQELADKLGVRAQELIGHLFGMGIMATINQRLEKDNIELLAGEYEREVEFLTEPLALQHSDRDFYSFPEWNACLCRRISDAGGSCFDFEYPGSNHALKESEHANKSAQPAAVASRSLHNESLKTTMAEVYRFAANKRQN